MSQNVPKERSDNEEKDEQPPPSRHHPSRRKHLRPSKDEPLIPFRTCLHNKYKLVELVGAGGYGQIVKAYWPEKKIHVAVKIMSRSHEPQRMILEQQILKRLQDKPNFPFLFGSGTTTDSYMFIVMELLGRSLSDLRKKSEGRRFDPATAIRVGIQALQAVQFLHEAGYVHRDLKPGNMCCGAVPSTYRTIYLVDFGLSRKFREHGKLIKRRTAGFRGTLRYVSINVHQRRDQRPCDDMVSLFYSIVELSEGMLPWSRFREPDDIERKKKTSKAADLCRQQPAELYDFYVTCSGRYEPDRPDYEELLSCLKRCLPPGGGGGGGGEEMMSYEAVLGVETLQTLPGSTEPTKGEEA